MGIRPEQTELVRVLFEGVRERPPESRAAWLAEACPTDPDVRETVLRMVAFDESGDTFLETPALAQLLTVPLFEAGDVVGERYKITGEARIGGMGEVYPALVDTLTGNTIALKTVRHTFLGLDETAARLRSEIVLNQRIAHTNVCKIYHLDIDRRPEGDVLYLTMDFLEGETLWQRLNKPLPKKEALRIARQIAAGLDAAHEEGVIHRDLTPGNVMLVPRSDGTTRAVILDFGIACTHEDGVPPVALAGTLPYMAPERWNDRGAAAHPSSDIYSFGVILYEMLTGRQPFDPETPIEDRKKLLRAPSTIRRGIEYRWDRVILRCLDPVPQKRFGRATEAINALRPARWPVAVAAVFLIGAAYFL